MLYNFISLFFSFIVKKFYRRITVIGEPIQNEPVIFASNHPNMGVDPILIGSTAKRPLYFMGKSTLFKNLISRIFFRSLHVIPAYRKSDNQDTKKNEESFKEVINILNNNGAFVIFPEGTSSEGRKLLPIKTGAARIAIQSGVKIQPVSITYFEPQEFRSYVTVTYHVPIDVKQFNGQVREVTLELENRLKKTDIELSDRTDDKILLKVAKIFVKANSFDDQAMLKRIATNLKEEKKKELLPVLDEFIQKCEKLGISPELIEERSKINLFLVGILGSLGALFNFIPKKITAIFVGLKSKSSLEIAQNRLILGCIFFLLWYLACGVIFYLYFVWGLILLPFGVIFLESNRVYFSCLRDMIDGSISKLTFDKEVLQRKLLEAE